MDEADDGILRPLKVRASPDDVFAASELRMACESCEHASTLIEDPSLLESLREIAASIGVALDRGCPREHPARKHVTEPVLLEDCCGVAERIERCREATHALESAASDIETRSRIRRVLDDLRFCAGVVSRCQTPRIRGGTPRRFDRSFSASAAGAQGDLRTELAHLHDLATALCDSNADSVREILLRRIAAMKAIVR